MFRAALLLMLAAAPFGLAEGPSFRWGEHAPGFSWGDDAIPVPVSGWTSADIPPDFKRYRSARYTQLLFNGNQRQAVARSSMEEKWRVPGGLVGVKGWRSDLYKWADGDEWTDGIVVSNGTTYIDFDRLRKQGSQTERGRVRAYNDGSQFLDVLTNTTSGKVFEVRKAIKLNGSWQRFVTYRDASQRPLGYAGPAKLDCHGCHNQAGTGGYNAGLIPGGDTILSDPLYGVESVEESRSERQESGASLGRETGTANVRAAPLSRRSIVCTT